jgi:hypothetical protein
MMPHRSREGALTRGSEWRQRQSGEEASEPERGREGKEMLKPLAAERELILAHREAV